MVEPAASWDLYRSFLEVVRDGSLSAAARRLGLTQPTVGRHVDALEQSLGIALFTRSQRGLLPTPAALELIPHAEAMAAAEAALRRAATGEARDEQGVVRLTCSEIMASEVLPPIVASFCAAHPRIEVELAVGNRVQDLLRRDADIAIRTRRPVQKALVAQRVGRLQLGLFAHRDYLAARGTPRSLADLAEHRMIGYDRDQTSFRSIDGNAPALTRADFGFRTDSDIAQLAALRAGVGIAGCQTAIAARDPNLLPVLAGELAFDLDIWLAMHEDQRSTQRIRRMFTHLAAALAAYARAVPP